MDILQNKEQTYISYSDEDLFVMMSFREENEMEAHAAFRIFYNRYKNFLWSLCYKVCQNDEELAKDVFMNTMMAVYQNSHTYNASKSKVTTWMSNIAKHEMFDLLDVLKEKRIGEKTFVPLDDNLVVLDIKDDTNIETPEKKALNEALQTLSEKERDVLLHI